MWLFVLFLTIPLIEIALFIQVGGLIGLWPTLAIVIVTAFLGTALLRSQGTQAMDNLRRSLSALQDPSESLAHGAMILFAGALLLTPGFFTDAVGFALMVPQVRARVFAALKSRVQTHVGAQNMHTEFNTGPQRPGAGSPQQHRPHDRVIEGEFEELYTDTEPRGPSGGKSGWTNP